ncbi:MAG: sigma-70 family RNA polymerase sigma factor [Deltaproteobacteria bacterium]|nr:sigma-70 family RNA polymerase sigma factor [Deltaproteobacteria bacterium]
MLNRKHKPGPEAMDSDSKPEKDLADAALLLSLVDSGNLRTDKPVFTGKISETRLNTEDEYELARRIQIWGDVDARNALIMANFGLVHMIVGQMLRPGIKYDDCLQEGTLGLIRATETFQPDRKIRFSTYAVFWIRSKLQRLIQNYDKESTSAIAPHSPQEEGQKKAPRARKVSLERTGSEGEEFSLADILASDDENPEETLLRAEKMQAIKNILQNVIEELNNPRLQTILERRILAESPESLEEVGARLNISRENCRLLESKMLKLAKEQLVNWRY